MTKKKRALLVVLLGLPLVCLVSGLIAHEPRPHTGRTGAAAEALTAYFESEAGIDGWRRTGAIAFDFGTGHHYLWDRERQLVRVRFGDAEVQLPLAGGRAILRRGGREVRGRDARVALREKAMKFFINDAFWLNPIENFRDEGVRRSVIERHGRDALLVEFTSGGLTPGDAYVWMPARGDEPMRWAMFVSVLPIGGIENTWEGWVTLPTGARVAPRHGNAVVTIDLIRNVRGARTLGELVPGRDPFAALVRANAPR
jgi:hypothetical protein